MSRNRRQEVTNPSEMIRLWHVENDGSIVSTLGPYSRCMRLRGLDSKNMTEDELMSVMSHFRRSLVERLPEHVFVQFIMDSNDDYSDVFQRFNEVPMSEDPILQKQRKFRFEFIKSKKLIRHTLHIVFGCQKGMTRAEFQKITKYTHKKRMEELDQLQKKIEAIVGSVDIGLLKVNRSGVFDLYWQILNPGDIKRPAELFEVEKAKVKSLKLHVRSPREHLFCNDEMVWHPNYLKIGPRYYSVLTLADLPEETRFVVDLEKLYALDLYFRLVTYFHIPEQSKIKGELSKSRRFAKSMASKRGNVEDYDKSLARDEQEDLAVTLAETGQRMLRYGAHIIIWGSTKKELRQRKRQIIELMADRGYRFFEETNDHDRMLMTTMPGMVTESQRHLLMTSNNTVDLIPLWQEIHGDWDPVLIMRTRRGEIYCYNPFESSRLNPNGSIIGVPGSGKSVTVNMLIATAVLQSRFQGQVVVVDFAGEELSSYLMLIKLLGGQFLPILSEKGTYAVNPFPPPFQALDSEDNLIGKTERYLVEMTSLLTGAGLGDPTQVSMNKNLIAKAVGQTYRKLDGKTPIYSDLLDTLLSFREYEEVNQETLHVVVDLLQGFLGRSDSKMFNRQSNVKVDSNFVVIDLFGIDSYPEQNIRDAIILMTGEWVRQIAFGQPERYTYCFFDEAAQLMNQPAILELMEELLRTGRKHRTATWLISQDYEKFAGSSLDALIRGFTTSQFFLNHGDDKESRDLVAKHYGFSERERELLKSLKTQKGQQGFAEILIRTKIKEQGENSVERFVRSVVRLELSPFDLEICTSDPEDRKLQRLAQEGNPHLSLVEVLEHLAYRWKPQKRAEAKQNTKKELLR